MTKVFSTSIDLIDVGFGLFKNETTYVNCFTNVEPFLYPRYETNFIIVNNFFSINCSNLFCPGFYLKILINTHFDTDL